MGIILLFLSLIIILFSLRFNFGNKIHFILIIGLVVVFIYIQKKNQDLNEGFSCGKCKYWNKRRLKCLCGLAGPCATVDYGHWCNPQTGIQTFQRREKNANDPHGQAYVNCRSRDCIKACGRGVLGQKTATCKVDCRWFWNNWSECDKKTGTKFRDARVDWPARNGGQPCPGRETVSCPVDCDYTWGEYSECDKNIGKKFRDPIIKSPPLNGGKQCPAREIINCAVDCDFIEGKWTECDKPCGPGKQTRINTIKAQPIGNGKACPPVNESKDCNLRNCDCDFIEGKWTDCSAQCGDGEQTRVNTIKKTALLDGKPCPKENESKPCKLKDCDCDFTEGKWTDCSVKCGIGKQTKSANIRKQPTGPGGKACPPVEYKYCESKDCGSEGVCDLTVAKEAFSGNYILENFAEADFKGEWSKCSKDCGDGVQKRKVSVRNYNKDKTVKRFVVKDLNNPDWKNDIRFGNESLDKMSNTVSAPHLIEQLYYFAEYYLNRYNTRIGEKLEIPGIHWWKYEPDLNKVYFYKTGDNDYKLDFLPLLKDVDNIYLSIFGANGGEYREWSSDKPRGSDKIKTGEGEKDGKADRLQSDFTCKIITESKDCNLKDCEEATEWSQCDKYCGEGKQTREIVRKTKIRKRNPPIVLRFFEPYAFLAALKEKEWISKIKGEKDSGYDNMELKKIDSKFIDSNSDALNRIKFYVEYYLNKYDVPINEKIKSPNFLYGNTNYPTRTGEWTFWRSYKDTYNVSMKNFSKNPFTWKSNDSAGLREGKEDSQNVQFEVREDRKIESKTCKIRECNKDCKVLDWNDWTPCSMKCGKGTKTRTPKRVEEAKDGGAPCPKEESADCEGKECPEDCKIELEWGKCSAICGNGIQKGKAKIVKEAKFGGKCNTDIEETKPCMVKPCPGDCKVSDWEWNTACSRKCGGGIRKRIRKVERPADPGGAPCPPIEEDVQCNTEPCSVDCKVSDWSEYGNCSKTCGGGVKKRTRTVIRQKEYNGADCPVLEESAPCNTQDCPVDCKMGDWKEWSKCTKECGGGKRTRTRDIIVDTKLNGAACPAKEETEDCNIQPCKIDCKVSSWGNWSNCSKQCGGGTRSRKRVVVTEAKFGGASCPILEETEACNKNPCPVDCEVSDWGNWGNCSKKCGGGIMSRKKEVLVEPQNGGKECPQLTQITKCNTKPCPINCQVSKWTPWTKCSKDCGGGDRSRTRTVRVQAQFDGEECPDLIQVTKCNTEPCPIDCEVTDWGQWGKCSKDCGGGKQYRSRQIRVPPQNGGLECPRLEDVRNCNQKPCPQNCEVSPWTDFSYCSADCGGGTQTRTRYIVKPPLYGGEECPELSETANCNEKPCPINCEVSDWSPFSNCSKECGGGTQKRTRSIITQPKFDGKECPPLVDEVKCNVEPCPKSCEVSDWSDFTNCSKPCGGGTQTRFRNIVTKPQSGGEACPPLIETIPCNTHKCGKNCIVSNWGEWSKCTRECGGGVRERKRDVIAAPVAGGEGCPPLVMREACNTFPCPIGGREKWPTEQEENVVRPRGFDDDMVPLSREEARGLQDSINLINEAQYFLENRPLSEYEDVIGTIDIYGKKINKGQKSYNMPISVLEEKYLFSEIGRPENEYISKGGLDNVNIYGKSKNVSKRKMLSAPDVGSEAVEERNLYDIFGGKKKVNKPQNKLARVKYVGEEQKPKDDYQIFQKNIKKSQNKLGGVKYVGEEQKPKDDYKVFEKNVKRSQDKLGGVKYVGEEKRVKGVNRKRIGNLEGFIGGANLMVNNLKSLLGQEQGKI